MIYRNKALIVIPARMGSSRFPGKPLTVVAGKTMIERVWRIAIAVPEADEVVIATESEHLRDIAEGFGARVILTSESCRTGTDRVAEAARILEKNFDIVCSFQGDSVLTPPRLISETLLAIQKDPEVEISTPAVLLEAEARENFVLSKQGGSSSGTTVVFDSQKNALYFSKALLPWQRDSDGPQAAVYRHIGLYCYRKETLFSFTSLPEGLLEGVEKLEQLRALENGIPIRVVIVDLGGKTPASIDVPEDAIYVEQIIAREGELLP